MNTERYQTTKLWKETIQKLKLIAAMTSSSIVAVADRLADDELNRLKRGEEKQDDD